MAVYAAYLLVVLHVAFGALQDARNPLLAVLVMASVICVGGLHVVASRRAAPEQVLAPWVIAGPVESIEESRAIVVHLADSEAVAIFRHGGHLSAVSNVCAHQNGPLGEGRIVDGCITCPWHGYQYRPEDGCAPPPFTERLATYRLRIENGMVLLNPHANPPGTAVEPVRVA